jgi:malate synthase
VSGGDILLAVMQILGGGVIGFFAGLWLGRKQIQYQRRVEVVDELRRRLREARESLANMATPHQYRLDPFWPEEVEEVGEKLDALSDYFEDKGNSLDTKTRKLLDDFTDEMAFLWADVRGRLDGGENLYPPLKAAWDWLDEADGAIEE